MRVMDERITPHAFILEGIQTRMLRRCHHLDAQILHMVHELSACIILAGRTGSQQAVLKLVISIKSSAGHIRFNTHNN